MRLCTIHSGISVGTPGASPAQANQRSTQRRAPPHAWYTIAQHNKDTHIYSQPQHQAATRDDAGVASTADPGQTNSAN